MPLKDPKKRKEYKKEYQQRKEIGLIRELVEKDLTGNLLFSHDVCQRSMYASYGGAGYDYVSNKLLESLAETGLTDEQVDHVVQAVITELEIYR